MKHSEYPLVSRSHLDRKLLWSYWISSCARKRTRTWGVGNLLPSQDLHSSGWSLVEFLKTLKADWFPVNCYQGSWRFQDEVELRQKIPEIIPFKRRESLIFLAAHSISSLLIVPPFLSYLPSLSVFFLLTSLSSSLLFLTGVILPNRHLSEPNHPSCHG